MEKKPKIRVELVMILGFVGLIALMALVSYFFF
jgi:hypothetical protein